MQFLKTLKKFWKNCENIAGNFYKNVGIMLRNQKKKMIFDDFPTHFQKTCWKYCILKSLEKFLKIFQIHFIKVFHTQYIIYLVCWASNVDMIAIKVLSIMLERWLFHASSSVNCLSSRNHLNYQVTLLLFVASWLPASCKVAVIIGTVLHL